MADPPVVPPTLATLETTQIDPSLLPDNPGNVPPPASVPHIENAMDIDVGNDTGANTLPLDSPDALTALAAAVLASNEFNQEATAGTNGHDTTMDWADTSQYDLATALIEGYGNSQVDNTQDEPESGSSTHRNATLMSSHGRPPYTAPSNVVYPPGSFRNPHQGSMAVQPTFANLPSGSLFRPAFLPGDIDTRIDQESVWMGVDRKTSKVVYFLPPTCKGCNHPAVAQFCDRGQPNCSRCAGKNLLCVPGSIWGVMKPKGRRKPRTESDSRPNGSPSKEPRRLTAEEKGKNRASDPPDEFARAMIGTPEDEGRGKRVKKRRRLSLTGEVDPNDYDDTGIKKLMRKVSKPSLPLNGSEETLTRVEDAEMARRTEANAARTALGNMTGSCPVWANSKRALEAAAEYFRKPVKTDGASVEIGLAGIARGVILEGQAPDNYTFWTMDERAGTIIVSIGPQRKDEKPAAPSDPVASQEDVYTAPLSPQLPIVSMANKPESPVGDSQERPEIEALLMAQRARTPIAVAVASDYSATPFKVPRRAIVLGWFWVTEAWLEPVSSFVIPPLSHRWRFRFDWCPGQALPWWLPRPLSSQFPTEEANGEVSAMIAGPGVSGSTTVRSDGGEDDWNHKCGECGNVSAKVYDLPYGLCLNHNCAKYNLRFVAQQFDRSALSPAPLRPLTHISPDSLGLRLRPEEPSSTARAAVSGRTNAGRDFWRAWVCGGCGLAQERKKWSGWECEACHRVIRPERYIYESDYFRLPTRPVYTGPRQEDGHPQWPFPSTRGWTLFVDDVKVVKHAVEEGLGESAEVHHALVSRPISADTLFRRLQAQGPLEVPFRRHSRLQAQTVIDKTPSPFYTFLCGTEAPPIELLPAGNPTPWRKCLASCFDAIDLINDMAGRMFPGQKERFNSLLLVAIPPELPTSLQPRIAIPANDYFAILFLGSDGGLKINGRADGRRGKQGSLTALHGDVIGLKTGADPVDITPHLDGFGFVGIGRQVYRQETRSPESSAEVESRLSTQVIKSRPRGPALAKLPKPAKLLSLAPLTDWYLGTRPLSRDQPLRVRAPLKQRVVNTEPEESEDLGLDATALAILNAVNGQQTQHGPPEFLGREEVEKPPAAELLRPTPVSPMGKKKKAEKAEKAKPEVEKKPRKKGKRKSEGTGTPSTIA